METIEANAGWEKWGIKINKIKRRKAGMPNLKVDEKY